MARLIIKEIAEMQGLNRSQLQLKSGVTLPLLNRYWKNTTESVKLDALEKIAKALRVKVEFLFLQDEDYNQGIEVVPNPGDMLDLMVEQ